MVKIFLYIFLFSFSLIASPLLDTAEDLQSAHEDLNGNVLSFSLDKIKSGFTGAPVESEYLRQARLAAQAVCNRSSAYRQLGAQNVWREIQAITKIQNLTTVNYLQVCSSSRAGNREFCDRSKPELIAQYKRIQECASSAVEERLTDLTSKLNKNKILSCVNKSNFGSEVLTELLGTSDVRIINTRYAGLNFSEVNQLEDLDLSSCNANGRNINIRDNLLNHAFKECGETNKFYRRCLEMSCGANIDTHCAQSNRLKCIRFTDEKENDVFRESMNRCIWNAVNAPQDRGIQATKNSCLGQNALASLQQNLNRTKPSVTGTCHRSIERCYGSIFQAFNRQEGASLCDVSAPVRAGVPSATGSR